MAKNKKKKLRGIADKLWFKACIKRYGNRCESCGSHANQVHHVFPKGMCSVLRFDIDNGSPICQVCHFRLHHLGDPTILQAIIAKRGQKWFDDLKAKSKKQMASYLSIGYYEDIINKLTKYLNG